MTPSIKSKQSKQEKKHPAVATATSTVETPVPTTPPRKRIPIVKASLVGAALNANPSVSQTPTSTVVSVTSTTPANGSTTSPASSATTPTPINAPPAVQVPVPPAGFVPPTAREYSGFYPSRSALVGAAQAVVDLQNLADDLAVLGAGLPEAAAVADAVQVGIDWNAERAATEAWTAYVRAQYGAAWKVATTLLEEVKPAFLGAVGRNPSLGLKYPGLMAMFTAPKRAATQATATKKRNAKAKAEAAGPATAAASPPSVDATPPKTVTLTV